MHGCQINLNSPKLQALLKYMQICTKGQMGDRVSSWNNDPGKPVVTTHAHSCKKEGLGQIIASFRLQRRMRMSLNAEEEKTLSFDSR